MDKICVILKLKWLENKVSHSDITLLESNRFWWAVFRILATSHNLCTAPHFFVFDSLHMNVNVNAGCIKQLCMASEEILHAWTHAYCTHIQTQGLQKFFTVNISLFCYIAASDFDYGSFFCFVSRSTGINVHIILGCSLNDSFF